MRTYAPFMWWHVEDGVARAYPDTPETRKRVDTERNWFGNVEGCILHGGVIATAFERKTERVFRAPWPGCADFAQWVPDGEITITTITAQDRDTANAERQARVDAMQPKGV